MPSATAPVITGPILGKVWTEDMPWSLNPLCPCQYGICGACDGANNAYGQARHDRCATRQHLGHYGRPPVIHDALTYKGFCKALVLTGCRYVCPCGCWKDEALAAPPPRRVTAVEPAPPVVAYVLDEDHPTLFDLEATNA